MIGLDQDMVPLQRTHVDNVVFPTISRKETLNSFLDSLLTRSLQKGMQQTLNYLMQYSPPKPVWVSKTRFDDTLTLSKSEVWPFQILVDNSRVTYFTDEKSKFASLCKQ